MCGIVGVITKQKHGFNYKEQKMFYEMLFADQLRGMDATGVITCHNNGDFGIMKEASEASTFNYSYIGSDLDKDLFKNGSAVIGHNRAKTVGENKDENAHPFVVDGTFAMVHNGTLRNHKKMHDTVVDSEALAITFKHAMDEEDFVQAVSEAVWEVQGAFACVWYDQKRRQVGMIRNSQRPLSIYETPDSILFGSEIGLLNWIASRNDQKSVSHKYLTHDTLYLFDVEKGGGKMEEFPLSQRPVVKSAGHGVNMTPTTQKNNIKTAVTSTPTFSAAVKQILAAQPKGIAPACSKNAFKRYKKNLIGRYIAFTLDDWVEKYFNDSTRPELIILGSCPNGAYDLCEIKHMIRCEVNTKDIGMSLKEVDFQSDWIGVVEDLDFDKGTVIIKVKNVKPVIESTTVH